MKILSRRAHGVLDYIVGILLLLAPYLLGFATGGPAQLVPQILGAGIILYSLLTNYELGPIKALPFRTHLTLDVIGGIFLLLSPWLFQFSEIIWWPHVLVGLLEIGTVLMTQTSASERATAPSTTATRTHL